MKSNQKLLKQTMKGWSSLLAEDFYVKNMKTEERENFYNDMSILRVLVDKECSKVFKKYYEYYKYRR